MGKEGQKTKKYESVRIWGEPKKRLENIILRKALKEGRRVTEVEMASKAIDLLCDKEERKLGIS